MELTGYSKLTLQDYPGHVAAICFVGGCQLRCPYCHNPDMVISNRKRTNPAGEETCLLFLSYIEKRKHQLDGVVVSGGEPLMQIEIQKFLQEIKEKGLKVKLDTNGLLPDKLEKLICKGLVDYVALDYKNCRKDFAKTVGLAGAEQKTVVDHYYDSWRRSLNCLRKSQIPYEIRTTVVRELHPLGPLMQMAKLVGQEMKKPEKWFLQNFVKSGPIMNDYMDRRVELSAYSNEELEGIRQELTGLTPGVQLRV